MKIITLTKTENGIREWWPMSYEFFTKTYGDLSHPNLKGYSLLEFT